MTSTCLSTTWPDNSLQTVGKRQLGREGVGGESVQKERVREERQREIERVGSG